MIDQGELGAGEDSSGYVIYEPVTPGETVFDTKQPSVVTGDGTKYYLPYIRVFDYGTDRSIVIENFADNDHQNNLGAAVATFKGENYTEGGGYWYVFADPASSLTNADGLAINAYNITEAVDNNELFLRMNISEFGGVGTNLLFEEYGADFSDLQAVEITLSGTGAVAPMFETTDIDKPTEWGNYAAPAITLTSTPRVTRYSVSDFVGEEFSGLEGQALAPHLNVASKLFFQAKNNVQVNIHIHKIEFFFTPTNDGALRVSKFAWKNDDYNPNFVFDMASVGVPGEMDPTDPYMDWSTATLTPAPASIEADDPNTPAFTGKNNWLSVDGTKLRDSHGRLVRLTGVNWFGFETKNAIPFGLWERDYKDMLQQIVDTGFNTVRIPFSDYIIDASKAREAKYLLGNLDISFAGINTDLNANMTPLELLDKIVDHARTIGLKIVLDNHSRGPDMYLVEGHWVTPEYPESRWISNWVWLADRYKDNDAVIGLDLNNEPHFEAAWGSSNPANNWNSAAERCANAIQAINPNVLIIVEGVEGLSEESLAVNKYWWGGNMQGVTTHPIDITIDNKLVYSPHEYGPEVYLQPWFRDYRFPNNLPYIWEDRFGFIYDQGIGHLLVGEFGIKNEREANQPAGTTSAALKWFTDFAAYMKSRKDGYSWTYWAWNPNSGDTGGILQNNWNDVHQWKLDLLEDLQAPMIGNQNGK